MKTKKNFYRVGDTVNVKTNMSEFTSVITEIQERLGKVNMGCTQQNPLVTFENGEHCDMGYITELVQRGKNVPYKPYNRYTPKSDWDKVASKTNNKRVICGTLNTLCHLYLGKLNEEILTEISGNKLTKASKSLTGVVGKYRGFLLYVKKDHFEKWFKKNWKKILMTKKEYGDMITKSNTEYEERYWRSERESFEREIGMNMIGSYPDEMEGIM